MTPRELHAALKRLSRKFKVRDIQLKVYPSRRRSYAFFSPHRIELAGNVWPEEQVRHLLHEFAHIVWWERNPGSRKWHGAEFKQVLWDVARYWFGDPGLYPWEWDYPSVETFAKSQPAFRRRP